MRSKFEKNKWGVIAGVLFIVLALPGLVWPIAYSILNAGESEFSFSLVMETLFTVSSISRLLSIALGAALIADRPKLAAAMCAGRFAFVDLALLRDLTFFIHEIYPKYLIVIEVIPPVQNLLLLLALIMLGERGKRLCLAAAGMEVLLNVLVALRNRFYVSWDNSLSNLLVIAAFAAAAFYVAGRARKEEPAAEATPASEAAPDEEEETEAD